MFQLESKVASAPKSQAPVEVASPTPWELISATEHHGAYIVNAYGGDVCDLYAMSNPMTASPRNGGTSFPIHFTDASANAALIVKAVNSHQALLARVAALEADLNECREFIENYVDVNDGDYGEPAPNRAMSLVSMIDETLNGRPY